MTIPLNSNGHRRRQLRRRVLAEETTAGGTMPASGRPWRRERAAYKDECRRINADCWLCNGRLGPIEYDAPPSTPLSFTVDHVHPTSLGADPMRKSMWKPAHFGCNSSRGNTTRGQFPTSRRW